LQIFTEESKVHIQKPLSALAVLTILRVLTGPENIALKSFKTTVNTELSLKNTRI